MLFPTRISLVALSTLWHQADAACVPGPLSTVIFPVTNVSLDYNNTRWGIPISVGTPAQTLAFDVVGLYNNTALFIPKDCGDTEQCVIQHGGIFNYMASSTWLQAASMSGAGAAPEAFTPSFNLSADSWGTDVLQVNSSFNFLHAFDLTGTVFSVNSIGLGRASSFLSDLKINKAIQSATWSYFHGLNGFRANKRMDGSVVFGGYDQAKTVGSNYSTDLVYDTGCDTGLVVRVSGFTLRFANGTVFYLNSLSPYACIDPNVETVALPLQIVDDIKNNIGGTQMGTSSGIRPEGLVYRTGDVYSGKFSIQLTDGPDITIPNDQLVLADQSIGLDGQTIYNDSMRKVLISVAGTNDTTMPYLGKPFLTSAYLMVNMDQTPRSLTLWQANATTDQSIFAVTADGEICDAEGHNVLNLTVSSSGGSVSQIQVSHGLEKGFVAGIVFGVAGFILIVFTLIDIFRNRRKQRRDRSNSTLSFQDRGNASTEHVLADGSRAYELQSPISPANTFLSSSQRDPNGLARHYSTESRSKTTTYELVG